MSKKTSQLICFFVAAIYVVWSGFFIYNSSFIAIDGNRHFSLVGDAMISMRYAWNLSHGNGLVWNAGERVEGYSNLLMTLIMSVMTWLFDKSSAVIAVQVFGIPTVLLSAYTAREISLEIFKENKNRDLMGVMVFLLTLFYYLLSYWSIMGMETGLVTLFTLAGVLFSLRWLNQRSSQLLNLSAMFMGLAFLTRNDALIFAVIVFANIAWILWKEKSRKNLREFIVSEGVYAVFVIALFIFRWLYYREIVPNTYTLKLGQIPMSVRLNDGILYVSHFLMEDWFPVILAVISLIIINKPWKWYFIGFPAAAILYQIWTGGDAWGRWRFIVPSIPFIFILDVGLLFMLIEWALKIRGKDTTYLFGKFFLPVRITTTGILFIILFGRILSPYWGEITFSSTIPDYGPNLHNMDVSIAINAITTPSATIGVFWAGAIPYYTGRYAIDFLGKSDKYIAGLYPHLPSKVTWFYQTTLPGHNKYDLYYSIKGLQPTYVQRFYWGVDDLRPYAFRNYSRLEYQGRNGVVTLFLKKDSKDVNWNKGIVIPWGNQ